MTLTIRARIALTFALLAALLTISGVLGFISTEKANSANRDTYRNKLAESTAIDNAEIYIARTRLVLDRVALHPEASSVPDQIDRAAGFFKNSDEWWGKFQQMPHEPDELPLIAKTTERRTAMRDAVSAFTKALQSGDKETADNIAMTQLSDLYSKMSAANNEVKKHLYENAKTRYEEAESNFYLFSTISGVMVVLGLVSAGLGWVLLRRAIMNPLNYALESLQEISSGNLSQTVRAQRNDEMGLLLESIEKTRIELGNVTGSVRSGSESVSVATRQIAAGMIDLSARTEEQAASLQETAASMNELTSAVKQNTDNARTGSDLAQTAANVATRGSDMVQRVVHTMGEIEGSSRKISDITALIEGIAFQTNILALNAAVEAARAGEQGRGFAVVASEVRSLAQRSAAAAKEIKDLIANSVQTVSHGTELVSSAGATMSELHTAVERVTAIMNEIASASEQQQSGIEQVDTAVTQMDEVTQQNAALVEQVTAAAQALDTQSNKLSNTVQVFRVA
ncbi:MULTISPECIES: methyl-accepting chemotaxis protein [unclassified Paraburkholderia]|uniref:methyl-accepting chemotaxis protein n=1 Tax=unclassified Paraburkholderia TaxID=2615204 RepID=UPI00197D494D|nr:MULTISPECIES: methyl-accepting chemotaxis protein [unclassified Paraburkholderia]MBN3858402.1 HAMP domain-containing protein [Paraburkholderia sp. Ac-20340]